MITLTGAEFVMGSVLVVMLGYFVGVIATLHIPRRK